MKSILITTLLSSVVLAHPPDWWGSHTEHAPPAHSSPPPAYSSAAPPSVKGPSSAGFKDAVTVLSKTGAAVCVDGVIPVTASTAKNIKWNYGIPANNIEVVETFLEYSTSGSPLLQSINGSYTTVSGTYNIHATLCTPKNNLKPNQLQLLTHGLGFDRTYWDFAANYSYVDVAVAHDHAVLFYDRLGVGQSEKPDPIQVIQTPLEVEIAHSLAVLARQGGLSDNKFSKIVSVGHSFGSIITETITSLYPTALDAAILTGFSANSSAVAAFLLGNNFAIASGVDPARFQNLNNGFVVDYSVISTQIGFFRAPGFDPAVLAAANAGRQPITFGELFTQGSSAAPAPKWNSPTAVVNGDEDLPFCSGNCSVATTLAPNLAAAVKPALYPNLAASNFDYYLAATTGHGLNLHYTANAAYEWIQAFLTNHNV